MIWVLLQRSRYGNAMTPLRFLFIFVFLCTRSFFLRNRLRECVPAIIASIMAKFEQPPPKKSSRATLRRLNFLLVSKV